MAAGIEQSIENSISALEKFDGGEVISSDGILSNLESQNAGMEQWVKNMETLGRSGGSGMTQALYDELAQMGPESANLVQELVDTLGSDTEEFIRICEEWTKALSNEDKAAIVASYTDVGTGVIDAVSEEISGGKGKIEGAMQEATSGAEDSSTPVSGVGDKMTTGIVEEIEGAEGAISEAVSSSASGGAQAALEHAQEYRNAGKTLGGSLAEGMREAQEEINNALRPDAEGITGGEESYRSAGRELTGAVASGIGEGAEDVSQKMTAILQDALNAVNEKKGEFQSAADSAIQMYASGMLSGSGSVVSNAGSIASRAAAAVQSYENAFSNAGYYMSAGVASGIRSGASGAINAAASMAASALAAAKAELDIHSPSKKFREQVGRQIPTGMAFGIRDKESLAGKAASKMSAKVYTNATSWLSKYKKKQQVTLEDEKWFWQQVVKHTKSGTTAYNNAVKKITAIESKQLTQSLGSSTLANQIAKNFGVSQTTKSGKKTKKKDTETYYSEIYSAAGKYLKNYQILHEMSEAQELAYWKSVQSRLKKNTQGWYDATAQIKELQQSIAENEAKAQEEALKNQEEAIKRQANVQQSILDKYKVYYKVSAKAEMEYWNVARLQFKAGTEERIEADQAYLEAQRDFYDQRKGLDEEYAENSKEINEKLTEDIQDLQDAYKDAVKSRKEDILSQMNLFDSWDSEGYDADTLLYNLKTQVAGLTFWEQQLEELGKKGLTEGLMDELKAMGPDAAASIYSLNQMTAEQLREYNRLWQQKNDLAQSQALKENEGLLQETNQQIIDLRTEAQAELNALNADYRAALAELNAGMSTELRNMISQAASLSEEMVAGLVSAIGKPSNSVEVYNSTTQLVNTVSSQLGTLAQEGTVIGKSTLDGLLEGLLDEAKINTTAQKVIQSIKRAMQEEAEIHSPARLFDREVGKRIPQGVAGGIEKETKEAEISAQDMVRQTITAAREEMRERKGALGVGTGFPSFSGIRKLNRLTEIPYSSKTIVNVDNSGILSGMEKMIREMELMTQRIESMRLVLYPDTLVGELRGAFDKANADTATIRNGRRY